MPVPSVQSNGGAITDAGVISASNNLVVDETSTLAASYLWVVAMATQVSQSLLPGHQCKQQFGCCWVLDFGKQRIN
jgi:hypothetical protein